MRRVRSLRHLAVGAVIALALPAWDAHAELVMKILIVNPSETEVREFDVHNPLPPEIKPQHVIDADGLKVDYDSQAGTYMLMGKVTLKPKESLTKRIVLEDVWVIGPERFTALRRETKEILAKLEETPYEERGQLVAQAIERQVAEVEESQEQPFLHPVQHINRYRDNVKTLQMVETDMVSLRQLMVMAALNPKSEPPPVLAGVGGADTTTDDAGVTEKGGLSILATWRLIFIILGLLAFVSLSFFLVWQRQLKLQLAKQAAQQAEDPESLLLGNGKSATPPQPSSTPIVSRPQPKTPLSP